MALPLPDDPAASGLSAFATMSCFASLVAAAGDLLCSKEFSPPATPKEAPAPAQMRRSHAIAAPRKQRASSDVWAEEGAGGIAPRPRALSQNCGNESCSSGDDEAVAETTLAASNFEEPPTGGGEGLPSQRLSARRSASLNCGGTNDADAALAPGTLACAGAATAAAGAAAAATAADLRVHKCSASAATAEAHNGSCKRQRKEGRTRSVGISCANKRPSQIGKQAGARVALARSYSNSHH